MKPVLLGAYVVMAIWMVVAAGRRIALLLFAGAGLDWSPFVSGGLGLLSLLLLLPALDERSQRR